MFKMYRSKKKLKTISLAILLIGLSLFNSGCGVMEYSTYSAARIDPNLADIGRYGVQFQIQELDINVSVTNNRTMKYIFGFLIIPPFIPINDDPAAYKSQLEIHMHFDAKSFSSNLEQKDVATDISFRPMDVRIESGGMNLAPKEFKTPESNYKNLTDNIVNPSKDPQFILLNDQSIYYVLVFERSESPDQPFVLQLKGLTKGGHIIKIPDIRFEKRGSWSQKYFP
jgi:hypothetical protein